MPMCQERTPFAPEFDAQQELYDVLDDPRDLVIPEPMIEIEVVASV